MSRDLRRYARQTYTRLVLGGLILLLVVGGGLIDLFYGREAALLGLTCILLGLTPLLLVFLLFLFLDWLVKRANSD
ncbi:MAG: hypothetical protein N2049_09300 [Anaerolineales bacterium]|nr:hypothetical protein [Anaerolineales bacterium]MCX7609396.1 hypothetical protein [Anaerolineales bacterium]MDW8227107.1 hypothetical protein [Anaerolineales bacterium]